ncbi:MAG: WYL domain-containing protein [Acidimicrobiaceae bacterium]|nr:WYL domain-containing protein [Acidimicrobiaceae bacterium]MCY4279681.1 WYL domain-containing protein [Acidimicrobiaceae bacterium]MCY4295065.1 WYL domain-containing protein [Acidimicrobiaceae bacterium]
MTPANGAEPARLTVTERMARLLGAVPWVVEQGGAHLEEIAARFAYPQEQLLEDLTQRLFFVGVHPFTPDTLIEVEITDGIVDIRYADWFSKPMRLNGEEATKLLAAGRTVLDMSREASRGVAQGRSSADAADGDSDDAAEPLVRALAKLALSLGVDGSDDAQTAATVFDAIDVCLGHAPSDTLNSLRSAISRRRAVDIDYYSQSRDAMTRRTVDPVRLFSDEGVWYLFGWCHHVEAERVFRVERIRDLEVLDSAATVKLPVAAAPAAVSLEDVESTATLRLNPEAAWAADYYPVRRRTASDDGSVEAVFAVAGEPWLARLLLQLGKDAELIDCHEDIHGDLRARTAARVLSRYRRRPT